MSTLQSLDNFLPTVPLLRPFVNAVPGLKAFIQAEDPNPAEVTPDSG